MLLMLMSCGLAHPPPLSRTAATPHPRGCARIHVVNSSHVCAGGEAGACGKQSALGDGAFSPSLRCPVFLWMLGIHCVRAPQDVARCSSEFPTLRGHEQYSQCRGFALFKCRHHGGSADCSSARCARAVRAWHRHALPSANRRLPTLSSVGVMPLGGDSTEQGGESFSGLDHRTQC